MACSLVVNWKNPLWFRASYMQLFQVLRYNISAPFSWLPFLSPFFYWVTIRLHFSQLGNYWSLWAALWTMLPIFALDSLLNSFQNIFKDSLRFTYKYVYRGIYLMLPSESAFQNMNLNFLLLILWPNTLNILPSRNRMKEKNRTYTKLTTNGAQCGFHDEGFLFQTDRWKWC